MNRFKFAVFPLLCLILISCNTGPRYNPYQSGSEISTGQASAVEELQRNAVDALEQHSWQQAIDYLQRAIRIEPRNALSWHYLAQTYWHRKDYPRCLEMIERSLSYSNAEDDLDRPNSELRARCQAG